MRDSQIRGLLARIESEQPPLGIDVDDIMRHGHQVRRRRKLAGVAGSSLATVAVGVLVSFSIPLGAPAPPRAKPMTPPPTPATSSGPSAPSSRSATPVPSAPRRPSATPTPPKPSTGSATG